jgi:hypothetical protein
VRRAVVIGLLIAAGVSMTVAAPSQAATQRSAQVLLNSLPVSPERTSGYHRDAFAGWRDANGNGCDTRQEVLIAERLAGRVVGCTVRNGRWRSSYDGVVTSSPRSFDIDHRVPLEEAWSSGAWRWTSDTRARYANDLGYSASLLAVTLHANRSKGDREPDEWMPDLRSQRCSYVKLWIGVKYRWRLSVDSAEKSFLARELRGCDPAMSVPRLAVVRVRQVGR